MTPEEAGEIILGGEAWLHCVVCIGRGWKEKPVIEINDPVVHRDDGTVIVPMKCEYCGGSGGRINEQYAEACRFLQLEVPQIRIEDFRLPIGRVTGIEPGANTIRVKHMANPDWGNIHMSGVEFIYRLK